MKIGRIRFEANGMVREIENIELEPGELEKFERLIQSMNELAKTQQRLPPPVRPQ